MYIFNPADIGLIIRHIYCRMFSKEHTVENVAYFKLYFGRCYFVSEVSLTVQHISEAESLDNANKETTVSET